MTTDALRPLVAGNWKMNGLKAALAELVSMAGGYDDILRAQTDLLICPPATLLQLATHTALGSRIAIGAQDCHMSVSGAHTGDISAAMIADCGATHVILGHSERRADHGETDAVVKAKAKAAVAAALIPIICVGETRQHREDGLAETIVGQQLSGSLPEDAAEAIVVAYEPVWAIGTGLTPTPDDVVAMHAFIRQQLLAHCGQAGKQIRILYGGSVKPGNARELLSLANVNGALVGGASLKAADFLAIAAAYRPVDLASP